MTGEVQFKTPILTEYAMTIPSLMSNVFLPLYIYNDAVDTYVR